MTIAAALICADGVVLCADTLLSANYRQQGQKVWLWNGNHGLAVAVTGAGPYVLLKLAKEAIFRKLAEMDWKLHPLGFVKHGVIEPTLKSIHEDHIDKATDWDRSNGYSLSLLVAVRDRWQTTCYETDRRACSHVDSMLCVGSGAPVGNYVASTLFSSALPVMWGQVAAAYLIQQTKAYGEDCGGDTNIVVIPNAADAVVLPPERIRYLEGVGTRIHEALGRVLFTTADPEAKEYQESLVAFSDAVNQNRNALMIGHLNVTSTTHSEPVELGRAVVKPTRTVPKRGRKGRPPSQG